MYGQNGIGGVGAAGHRNRATPTASTAAHAATPSHPRRDRPRAASPSAGSPAATVGSARNPRYAKAMKKSRPTSCAVPPTPAVAIFRRNDSCCSGTPLTRKRNA